MGLVSVIICIVGIMYASYIFYNRNVRLHSDGIYSTKFFDEVRGPVILASVLLVLLLAVFGATVVKVVRQIF